MARSGGVWAGGRMLRTALVFVREKNKNREIFARLANLFACFLEKLLQSQGWLFFRSCRALKQVLFL